MIFDKAPMLKSDARARSTHEMKTTAKQIQRLHFIILFSIWQDSHSRAVSLIN